MKHVSFWRRRIRIRRIPTTRLLGRFCSRVPRLLLAWLAFLLVIDSVISHLFSFSVCVCVSWNVLWDDLMTCLPYCSNVQSHSRALVVYHDPMIRHYTPSLSSSPLALTLVRFQLLLSSLTNNRGCVIWMIPPPLFAGSAALLICLNTFADFAAKWKEKKDFWDLRHSFWACCCWQMRTGKQGVFRSTTMSFIGLIHLNNMPENLAAIEQTLIIKI